MKGLIIDTTVKRAYVAAFDDEKESIVYLQDGLSTASALVPAVRDALAELSLDKKYLDGVAAVVGPGSFTGIRIGVSFINALAYALGIPRFRITSFDVMRACSGCAPAYLVDAGHSSYYAEVDTTDGAVDINIDAAAVPEGAVKQDSCADELPQGALRVLRMAIEQHVYALCAPSYLVELLKPHYMRKSQAERVKEASHD